MPFYATDSITLADVRDLVSRYPEHVAEGLKELDEFRYETLPERVLGRKVCNGMRKSSASDVAFMSKAELVELVTWKLKHGTFRPKLKQLVESNDEDLITNIMKDIEATEGRPKPAKEMMQMLTQLKGIGPATASLIMSCISPLEYPFFSDELFRWIHWDGLNADGTNAVIKAGKGWARPIGYTSKEYDSLITRCKLLQARLSDTLEADKQLSFFDMEKAAYVLGQEKTEITSAPGTDEGTTRKTFNDEKSKEKVDKLAQQRDKAKEKPKSSATDTKTKKRSAPPTETEPRTTRSKRNKQ